MVGRVIAAHCSILGVRAEGRVKEEAQPALCPPLTVGSAKLMGKSLRVRAKKKADSLRGVAARRQGVE